MLWDAVWVYIATATTVLIKSNGFISSETNNETNCFCPLHTEPVCGTDGATSYTYINRCILNCNQRHRPELRWDYDGYCCDYTFCPLEAKPVCDAFGRRHLNFCYFRYAQCLEERKYGRKLGLQHPGKPCRCSQQCTLRDDPVCDNTGNTHKNLCFLRNAECFANEKYGANLALDYYGTCCDALCQDIPRTKNELAVCDNFGNVHKTFCAFHVAKCVAERKFGVRLSIAKYGVC